MRYRAFDPREILSALRVLWPYTGVTLTLLVVSLVLGLLLGFLLCWLLLRPSAVLRGIARLYLTVVRGAPAVVLLFLVYYGLPGLLRLLSGSDVGEAARYVTVIVTFMLIAAGQMAYILFGAYHSIPPSQIEAAIAMGYAPHQVFFHLLLPQGARFALPNLLNTAVALLKEGAVAYTIGLVDLVGRAQRHIVEAFGGHALETYLALALIFLLLTGLIDWLGRRLERTLSRHEAAHV